MKLVKWLILAFILFIYIYAPPFTALKINSSILVVFICVLYAITFYGKTIFRVLSNRTIFYSVLLFFSVFLISVLYDYFIFKGLVGIGVSGGNFLVLLEVFLFSIIFVVLLSKYKVTHQQFINLLISIGLIQSIFVLVMLLNQELRLVILTNVLKFSDDSNIFLPGLYAIRTYGIAKGYWFGLPLFQGLVVVLVIHCSINKSPWYLLTLPLLLLSIALNARIGFVVPIVYLALKLGTGLFSLKGYINFAKYSMFLVLIAPFVFLAIINMNFQPILDNILWIIKGFFDIQDEDSILVKTLLAINIPLYSLSDALLGIGLFNTADGKMIAGSDSGYPNVFVYGGFLYSFLLYSGSIYLGYTVYKGQNTNMRFIVLTMILVIILAQAKANLYASNAYFKIYILYFFYMAINSNKSILNKRMNN